MPITEETIVWTCCRDVNQPELWVVRDEGGSLVSPKSDQRDAVAAALRIAAVLRLNVQIVERAE